MGEQRWYRMLQLEREGICPIAFPCHRMGESDTLTLTRMFCCCRNDGITTSTSQAELHRDPRGVRDATRQQLLLNMPT